MFFSWYDLTMLAFESTSVIGLRLTKILQGGSSSIEEIGLMCSEKVLACSEAGAALATGVSADGIVALYRSKVASNEARLGMAPS